MTDLLQKQNSAKESEGFNVQSFNYGKSDTVAHEIAHRNITAELSVSDISLNNNSYSGGNNNESFGTDDWNNYCDNSSSAVILRAGVYWNSEQNNRLVCLSENINEQDRLNNSKNRTVVVIGIGFGESEPIPASKPQTF